MKFFLFPLFLSVLLATAACGDSASTPAVRGRMLLWHTWQEGDAEALSLLLNTFRAVHPDVVVKEQRFPTVDEMLTQFRNAADAGLGPDLLLAPGEQVRALATAGLIDPIDARVDDTLLQRYMPATLDALRVDDRLYGLPATLDTLVLYYDRRQLESPASTLDELLAAASAGQGVAISTNFVDAFWGVQAFGGQLFDEAGRVILDRGGFANWLAWLQEARNAPGMILESNREVLRASFATARIAYYVGYASELAFLREGLPADQLGVALLPAGPNGRAAPFLTVQAFQFSTVSSENQRELALELATFLTNAEQQSTLMRRTGFVPTNSRVRINARLNPLIASFVAQARSAVPLPNASQMDAVLRLGGDAYTRVLEGLLEPAEAAIAVTLAINEANGFVATTAPQYECRGVGTLYLGHALTGRMAEALTTTLAELRQDCPTIFVSARQVTQAEAAQQLRTPWAADGRLDFLLVPQSWIADLAAQNQLLELTALVDAEALQRYRPLAVDGMRYQGALYGLPAAMELDALYYNRQLVSQPARTLDELRAQARSGVPVALDVSFRGGFWGIAAFGGQLFDQDLRLTLDQAGFAPWLAWLAASRAAGITMTMDRSLLRAQFVAGESAYYVAGPAELRTLQEELGRANLGVTTLPSGSVGDAGPLLQTTGFLLSARLSEPQQQLALEVIQYATSVDNQARLLTLADSVPTNVGLDVADDSPIAAFVEQARTAQLLVNAPQMEIILRIGNSAYQAVLRDELTPSAATVALQRRFDQAVIAAAAED